MSIFNKYKMFGLYYIIGIISASALSAYPVIYMDKGFNTEQIAALISVSFIAMIFQPLVGYYSDKLNDNIKSLKIVLILFIVSSLIMFASVKLFVIGLVVNSIMRTSIVPLIDGFVTRNIDSFEFSYAQMRTAMPIGFGTAVLVSLLFVNLFGLPISGMLIFLSVLAVIMIIIIHSLNGIEDGESESISNEEGTVKSNVKLETNWKYVILLGLFYLLYPGMYQVSSSYQSVLITDLGHGPMFIGVLNLLMVAPQIYLLFNYQKVFKNFKSTSIMLIVTVLGIIQALIYIVIPTSIIMLVIASMLGGIQIVLFPASFFPQFTSSIKSSKLSTVLTLNTAIQAVIVGLYNQGFISKLLDISGNIKVVYLIVMITMLMGIIPVLLYKRESGE